jgi:hypothetical protein
MGKTRKIGLGPGNVNGPNVSPGQVKKPGL